MKIKMGIFVMMIVIIDVDGDEDDPSAYIPRVVHINRLFGDFFHVEICNIIKM